MKRKEENIVIRTLTIKVTGEEKKSHIGVTCGHTGARCSNKGAPIVPVKVKDQARRQWL